jgi:hypothetical protein
MSAGVSAIPSLRDVQSLASDLQFRISALQARIEEMVKLTSTVNATERASEILSVTAEAERCEHLATTWTDRTAAHLERDRAFAATERRWQTAGVQLEEASQLRDAGPHSEPNTWIVWFLRQWVQGWRSFRQWPFSSQVCTAALLLGSIYWWMSRKHRAKFRGR